MIALIFTVLLAVKVTEAADPDHVPDEYVPTLEEKLLTSVPAKTIDVILPAELVKVRDPPSLYTLKSVEPLLFHTLVSVLPLVNVIVIDPTA